MMFAFWRSLNSVAASDECRQTILDGIEPRCNVGVDVLEFFIVVRDNVDCRLLDRRRDLRSEQ